MRILIILSLSTLYFGAVNPELVIAQEADGYEALVYLRSNLPRNHPAVVQYLEQGLEIETDRRSSPDAYLSPLRLFGPKGVVQSFIIAIEPYREVQSIELTIHMLEAARDTQQVKVAEQLEAVVQQLERTFGYTSFTQLETILMRTVTDASSFGSMRGTLPTSIEYLEQEFPNLTLFYMLQVRGVELIGEEEILIDMFEFTFQAPYLDIQIREKDGEQDVIRNVEYRDTGLQTKLGLTTGKQVVVGKANVNSSTDALFIVVSAKVVD